MKVDAFLRSYSSVARKIAPSPLSAARARAARLSALKTAAGALIIYLLLAGHDQSTAADPPAAPPPVAVDVVPASMKGIANAYTFLGRIRAVETVQLRARVQGFLEQILFRDGQDVKVGDVLYLIEQVQYRALVDQASANLTAAQAQETNARLNYERSTSLVKTQATAQATLDLNKAALDVARANILQTQAALVQAEQNLGYTTITAPIDGRIGKTTYTQGNLVGPTSDVLATIVSQDPIYVEFPMNTRQFDQILATRPQGPDGTKPIDVYVTLPSGDEYRTAGKWNFSDVRADPQTNTVLVRGELPNPGRRLIDGSVVTVRLKEQQSTPRLVVPQRAIQVDQSGSYVYVVGADNKVDLRRVRPGGPQNTDIIVEAGLNEGDLVVVGGLQKIRPGQTVSKTTTASQVVKG